MATFNRADQASKENLLINKRVMPADGLSIVYGYGAGLRAGGYTHIDGRRTQTKGRESRQR